MEKVLEFSVPQNILWTALRLRRNQLKAFEVTSNLDEHIKLLNVVKSEKNINFSIDLSCLNLEANGNTRCYLNLVPSKAENDAAVNKAERNAKELVNISRKRRRKPKSESEAPIVMLPEEGKRYSTRPGRQRIVQLLQSGKHPLDKEMVSPDVNDDDLMVGGPMDDDLTDKDYADQTTKRKTRMVFDQTKKEMPKTRRPNYKREANVPCKLCGLKYKDYSVLFGHVKVMHSKHPKKKEYQSEIRENMKVICEICQRVLRNKLLLVEHKARKHSENAEAEQFSCEICDKTFKNRVLLKDHVIQTHREKKKQQFLCHLCPGKFTQNVALKDHVKSVHERDVLYQCEECQKTFYSPRYLKRHMFVHSSVLSSCSLCSYTTKHPQNLKRHLQDMHDNSDIKKVIPCPQCDKEFKNLQNMQVHLNYVHFKVTPYYCSLCKKYLLRKSDLMDHAESTHPGMVVLASEENKINKSDDGRYTEPKMQIVDKNQVFPLIIEQQAVSTEEASTFQQSISGTSLLGNIELKVAEDQTVGTDVADVHPVQGDTSSQQLPDAIIAAATLESLVVEVVNVGDKTSQE